MISYGNHFVLRNKTWECRNIQFTISQFIWSYSMEMTLNLTRIKWKLNWTTNVQRPSFLFSELETQRQQKNPKWNRWEPRSSECDWEGEWGEIVSVWYSITLTNDVRGRCSVRKSIGFTIERQRNRNRYWAADTTNKMLSRSVNGLEHWDSHQIWNQCCMRCAKPLRRDRLNYIYVSLLLAAFKHIERWGWRELSPINT